jgi:hypothetical protein
MTRDLVMTIVAREADGSLSNRERDGVRGYTLSMAGNPLTPTLSPNGERERTEFAALFAGSRSLRKALRAFILALLLVPGPALAQSSQRPIQIIVPFAPGASADGAARIVANELGPRLGRQVVVEHRAGAGGTLGLQMLAKSAPDGDTLGVGATGALLLNPNLPSNPGPDLLRELAPVAKLIDVAIVLVANPSTGPKSIAEMIERSKTTPGGLTYGSTGTNTSQHVSIELFKRATGANLVHVPYRGSAPAVVDLIAGQIPLVWPTDRTRAQRRQTVSGGAGDPDHRRERRAGLRTRLRIHRTVCPGRNTGPNHQEALARGRRHSRDAECAGHGPHAHGRDRLPG